MCRSPARVQRILRLAGGRRRAVPVGRAQVRLANDRNDRPFTRRVDRWHIRQACMDGVARTRGMTPDRGGTASLIVLRAV